MRLDDHFFRVMDKNLRDLVPLIKAAVQALDRPGNRALRRKLDSGFHVAVHAYNSMWRAGQPMSDYPMGNLVEYDRATPVRWGGRKPSSDAAVTDGIGAKRPEGAGLRLVVDNTGVAPRAGRPRLPVIDDGGSHDAA